MRKVERASVSGVNVSHSFRETEEEPRALLAWIALWMAGGFRPEF